MADYAKLIREHVTALMPEPLRQLKALAFYDLNFGPVSPEDGRDAHGVPDWSGYVDATDKLEEWARDEMPSTLYIDTTDPCVYDTTPEAWRIIADDGGGVIDAGPYFSRDEALEALSELRQTDEDAADYSVAAYDEESYANEFEWVLYDRAAIARAVFGLLITQGGMSF